MTASHTPRFHAFERLVLTLSESSLEGVRTDHSFELRGVEGGAEVWRSSVLHAGDDSCESGERFVGKLASRQVIDLLTVIERSGAYEALPAVGLVQGMTDSDVAPTVSMRLESATQQRDVLADAPADRPVVHGLVRAVQHAVAEAQERALTMAG